MAKQTIKIGALPNDGRGDSLRNAFIKVNANTDELYGLKFGKYNYDHGGSTQSITASAWTPILNDGAGVNTILTCAYPDVDIYDTTTSLFNMSDLDLCSDVDIRFDANVTTTSANQVVRVRVLLAIGVLDIPLTFISNQFKTAGSNPLFGNIRVDALSELTRINDFRIEIWSDSACTLALNGWNLKVSKKTH